MPLRKRFDGTFEDDKGTHRLIYDSNGVYMGQWQPNVLGDSDEIWLDNVTVLNLSQEEMKEAIK